MRPLSILYPVIMTVAVTNGVEAGGLGSLIGRAGKAGAAVGRIASATNNLVKNASTNIATRLSTTGGNVGQAFSARATAVRNALSMTADTKSKLKITIVGSTVSGVVSGNISGQISKNSGKSRRSSVDRREMLSREIHSRQGETLEAGTAPEGIPQDQWDVCFWEIVTAASVVISGENNWIQIDGLPPICVYINDNVAMNDPEAFAAINCGESCLKYENLSADDFDAMADYWNAMVTN